MRHTPFDLMQMAVDIVNSSPHPTSKIAATLSGTDAAGKAYWHAFTNYWPEPILRRLGPEARIGNASGTIHAETACILKARHTEGASVFVTDPFCPNCAKNMAEAGVRNVFIDHKGFDKDFAARRGHHFDGMSMRICEKAGINVFELRRREEKIVPILEIPEDYAPPEENPVEIAQTDYSSHPLFSELVKTKSHSMAGRNFALALAENHRGETFSICALPHAAVGFTTRDDAATIAQPQGKYSFIQEPVNRLLMNAARRGLALRPDHIFSARVPTAREQVNLLGAGLHSIMVGDLNDARDDGSLAAMQILRDSDIMAFSPAGN